MVPKPAAHQGVTEDGTEPPSIPRIAGTRCGGTHAVGVGNANGAGKVAGIPDPVASRHFAIAIEVELTGADRLRLSRVTAWKNCGDTGIDGPHTHLQFTISLDDRTETDLHAWHIGNRVPVSGMPFKRQAKVPGARLRNCIHC